MEVDGLLSQEAVHFHLQLPLDLRDSPLQVVRENNWRIFCQIWWRTTDDQEDNYSNTENGCATVMQ